ncbi:peptide chain release factor H [Comamonas serinivorans]|uniref:Peptide chain release factor H n=1 Tax=Comamonas serinivorans TaxID=1082851 RepID=A0A1Y0EJQ2_9BURK|nr:peptide chain release factor H [Comamonas serinivorans]ARU03658.1 peptide chain release factor H [Comamonas serinivorans]
MLLIQITAAHGPAECERAAQLTLRALLREAAGAGIAFDVLACVDTPAGCQSALLRSAHEAALPWVTPWLGTIQWTFASPFRPHHRRKNWFVAVQRCALPEAVPTEGEIRFQACKASGAGGQHVNTTDSAVHATHVASGLSVKVGTERSQHANKRLARELLAIKLAQRQASLLDQAREARARLHGQVARGDPVKVFHGPPGR